MPARYDTKMDRVAIRRKNFIPADAFPYQTPVALQYDSGNYQATLDACLKAADHAGFEARRTAAAAKGKLRGIGVSTYLEACGIAPSAVVGSLGARAGLYEVANIKVHPTGSVTVYTGTHSHGQGHETTLAQLVCSQLGVPLDQVDIVHGDTAKIPFGMGTYGSRSLAVGGSAMVKAMDKIIAKGKKIAAHLMEASVDDIEFKDGTFTVAGTDKTKTLTDISLAAYVPHNYPIEELEPGLDETSFYDPKNFTFPGGCHIAEVEIDQDTGVVEVVNFVAVDDVGRVINPMIVEGQVQGGVAQGIGQALLEHAVYDESGQLLSGSMMDYTMPRADDLPNITVGTEITLCTHNPLGVKGCGEVGAIGSPPAIINAIVDALKDYGVRHIDMPATPQKLWSHHAGCEVIGTRNSTMYDFAYQKPSSLADAVKALSADADAKALAGGMTLIPVLKQRLNKPIAAGGPGEAWADRHHGVRQRRDHHRRHDDARRGRRKRRT